jgi:putative tricarboxylic transport membrane protein
MRFRGKHIDGRELTTAAFFLGVSLLTLWESYRLAANPPAYRLDQPLRPGMYLAIIGALLLISGLIYLFRLLSQPQDAATVHEKSGSVVKIVVMMAILTAYALLIGRVGYILATFLFFMAAFRFFGLRHPVAILAWSTVFTGAFTLVFVYYLRVPLPSGVLAARFF